VTASTGELPGQGGPDDPTVFPPPRKARLWGVDAARGVALIGMVAVHALYDITSDGAPTTTYSLAAGRSAAAFALLAGVGIAFTTGRRQVRPGPEGRRAAASLVARGLSIGAIGLMLGYTDSDIATVILPYYALLFLLAVPLVFLRTRALVLVGVAAAVVVPVLSHLVRPYLPAPSLENPGVSSLVQDPLGLLAELALTGTYPAVAWLTYICVGIAIGRVDLASLRVATRLVVGGLLLAVLAQQLSWLLLNPVGGFARIASVTPDSLESAPTIADYVALQPNGTTPTTTWWWLAVEAPHSSTPLDLLQTTGSAMALLGVMLVLGHVVRPRAARILTRAVLSPLSAIGAMTLTLYTASVVFMNSELDVFDATTGFLLQLVVAVVFAVTWRKAVSRGPLETVVHWICQGAGSAFEPRRSRSDDTSEVHRR
jgi:uncharacterized membrane protein